MRGQLEAELLDSLAPMRHMLKRIADDTGSWAGIPMPLSGERLIVEPRFPKAKELMAIGAKKHPCGICSAPQGDEHAVDCQRFEPGVAVGPHDDGDGYTHVNEWYCPRWRCKIVVMRRPDGRSVHGKIVAFHHIKYDLSTLGCSDAWGLEQEHRAMQLLGTMIRHRQMKQYCMTGMFLERSRRSGITYMFRRLKPTIALAPDRRDGDASMRILAALCMHPIAYYAGSWSGAMCPTDDVVAHLSLMRGDEHMFWKRCNQHPPYLPEAGL